MKNILSLLLLVAAGHATPVVYKIAPNITDAAIDTYLDAHNAYVDTTTVLRNQLFLFFPGSGGTPAYYTQVCSLAAVLGYHSIA